MNSKKLRLFLLAGFAFFAFLVIATFWNIISEYYRLQAEYPNDIEAQRNFGFGTCVFMLLAFPLWGAELSFIRSVYKILKHKPQGYVQICYTISACIAVFMLIFNKMPLFSSAPVYTHSTHPPAQEYVFQS
jgi:hypothetical protein